MEWIYCSFIFLIACQDSTDLSDVMTESQTQETILFTDKMQLEGEGLPNESRFWNEGLVPKLNWKKDTIGFDTYVNDTLHGPSYLISAYDHINDSSGKYLFGNYNKGKREGIFMYLGGYYKPSAYRRFEADTTVWSACYAANQSMAVPIKPFYVKCDSCLVEVPHPNGQLWYSGVFVNGEEVGIHRTYNEDGSIRSNVSFRDSMSTIWHPTGMRKESFKGKKYYSGWIDQPK